MSLLRGANAHRTKYKPGANVRLSMQRLIPDTRVTVVRVTRSWWVDAAQPDQRERFTVELHRRFSDGH